MKKSCLAIIVISLVLLLGIALAGCTQYPCSSQAQPTGNAVTPAQTPEQSGSGGSSLSIAFSTPDSHARQNNNPPRTGGSQRTYVVAMTATDNGTAITATYRGGQDAAYLVAVTLSINGAETGEMSIPPGSGQTSLPVGTHETFPVTGSDNHLVAVGHFSDGATKVIFDQTI